MKSKSIVAVERRTTRLMRGSLERIKSKISLSQDPELWKAALKGLLQDADELLSQDCYSVVCKEHVPPSESKHDYFSLSIYKWPDPNTADGLPYISRDGHINPEVEEYDGPNLGRMSSSMDTLNIAYYLTGKEEYAQKAGDFLRTWFLDSDTRMNPNMLYAQYVPGDGGFVEIPRYPNRYILGKNTKGVYVSFGGIIEGTRLAGCIDSIDLIRGSTGWSEEDHSRLQDWFREFLHWILHSNHGKDEASCFNNHGSWYCVQAAAYAIFCEEFDIARDILIKDVPKRIQLQFDEEGKLYEELNRAHSFGYVSYGMASFFNLANMAKSLDIDLWNYETEHGKPLKKAIDWMIPFLDGSKKWPYPLIDELNYVSFVPLLHMAADGYNDNSYTDVIKVIPGYRADNLYKLLYF